MSQRITQEQLELLLMIYCGLSEDDKRAMASDTRELVRKRDNASK